MAQHDYVIANGTGAAVRSDLNNALAAIVSNNSGATEPATMYAYQWWPDTTTGLLKIRNAANNAWVTVGTLASANLGLLSSGSTVTAALGSASTPGITFTGDTNTGIYSPGADQVAISTGGTGRLFVDSSGRVGAGTSSPGGQLEVFLTSATDPALRLRYNSSSYYADHLMDGNGNYIIYSPAANGVTSGNLRIRAGSSFSVSTNNQAATSPALTIDTSSRVGIGTTSPSNKLHSVDTAAAQALFSGWGSGGGFTYNGQIRLGTVGSYQGIIDYDGSATILSFENTYTDPTNSAITWKVGGGEKARLTGAGRLLVGTSTSIENNALLQVYRASGIAQAIVESASLSNNQYVAYSLRSGGRYSELGIFKHAGITNPGPYLFLGEEDGASAYYWTDNSGNFRVSNNGDHIGTTSGTVVGTQTSDERLKNIIGPVEYGLDTINQLEPVRFALKSEPDTEKLGFIAQQVQPLIPQSVFDTNEHIEGEPEDAPTKLGMEYVALIPVLVNAIKELSAEVDALKAQLA